ncbi:hypothetical protein COT60_00780 [Candidatus Pacearchaeota archaeon CG09_land_8_20_14_0_10_30_9]|nr:MAG: hypothetical protein AUJ61_03070 [Candidatus Pacearchaeota archaeon CG1_02_30_18]PIN71468.1 MAG: hypothetical protein COV77_01730 [Candidatus Pacearchaeota archaeon CG11_big_fil_rev_8_21_14_0_20_30_13]PIO01388.1 MAG: hypothetical protein COT60_00780 [Candidatus Pacearchaeota archaeon CG09_land_8_20_14_0_10_30_9]PIZ81889.1 MAG: hypothetical protein COX98_02040 [Candidatus Pacearchaeota archaeon CG_4_10_14_0_2_um_filter_30_11]PJA71092.1 MAG: hypothetical protein CO153_03350 [Candidatus Pa
MIIFVMSLLTKDMHKQDVEKFLEGKGDFIRIDHLDRYLKLMPPVEMRKFAYIKLAEIYIAKEMYSSAAEAFKNAALNSVTFREKQENFLNEAKAYISSLKFEESDKALKRAFDEANPKEKDALYFEFIKYFKIEIEKMEKQGKPGHLLKLYEKFLRLKIEEPQKEEIKEKLLKTYEKLGKLKEYKLLKESGKI